MLKIGLLLTAMTLVLSSLKLEFKLRSIMSAHHRAVEAPHAWRGRCYCRRPSRGGPCRGGIAIGVCVSHMLADLASAMTFLNAWAASCKGEAEVPRFTLDLADYFPPREFPDSPAHLRKLTSNEKKIVTKRFVFNKEKLEALKQAAASPSGSNVKNPTRVEVVSAFIWKHFIDVAKSENPETKRTFAASLAVNLREEQVPSCFGECFRQLLYVNDSVVRC
ncbi:UNVERIFIED_CONTAM: Stemmadenine O-acetyltransferase [Sesamum radiatum]|uniref:Stemmadenine O-acetyltransferase n=1 Tax=Sesamum radiatum TaxID=300843 RepID=A0AAW2JQZ5_SESRA